VIIRIAAAINMSGQGEMLTGWRETSFIQDSFGSSRGPENGTYLSSSSCSPIKLAGPIVAFTSSCAFCQWGAPIATALRRLVLHQPDACIIFTGFDLHPTQFHKRFQIARQRGAVHIQQLG
jgi:hypothetical protein